MLVECTRAWWHNKTYHEAGSKFEVPEGTSIPSGFIVDGVATPTKSRKHLPPKVDEKDKKIVALENQFLAFQNEVKATDVVHPSITRTRRN